MTTITFYPILFRHIKLDQSGGVTVFAPFRPFRISSERFPAKEFEILPIGVFGILSSTGMKRLNGDIKRTVYRLNVAKRVKFYSTILVDIKVNLKADPNIYQNKMQDLDSKSNVHDWL